MARASRREMPRSRRQPFREPRTRILVLCCGRQSEPQYFNGLVAHVRSPSVTIKIKSGTSNPAGLVEQAKAYVDSDDFDQVWCVVDVDEFDIARAVQRVRPEPKIRLAVSNPCFELWRLLHFQEHASFLPNCSKADKLLNRHVPNAGKAVQFRKYEAGIAHAIERARKLGDTGESFPNPSTGVWRLVELITSEGR